MYGVGLAVELDVELEDVELDVEVDIDSELVVGMVEVSECEIVLSSS